MKHHRPQAVPQVQSTLALGNCDAIYDLLFRSAWKTLRDVIADEQQFEAVAVMVLRTWNQKLEAHAHVHALVPGDVPSLTDDRDRYLADRCTFCCAPHGNLCDSHRQPARRIFIQQLAATYNHRIRLDRNHRSGQNPGDKLPVTR